MKKKIAENPKVDGRVVALFERLRMAAADAVPSGKGAEYHIAPPLGRTVLLSPQRPTEVIRAMEDERELSCY